MSGPESLERLSEHVAERPDSGDGASKASSSCTNSSAMMILGLVRVEILVLVEVLVVIVVVVVVVVVAVFSLTPLISPQAGRCTILETKRGSSRQG